MNTPKILLNASDYLVLDKPAGWVINESKTAHKNPTVQDWIAKECNFEISKNRELRNGIVHRLDKETSGCLLVAKTEEVFNKLQKQFADREVEKTYQALVHGKLTGGGQIEAPIMRNPQNRKRFTVLPEGREALTKFKVLQNFNKKGKDYTLLELYPKTGRTHQLRVHLRHIGYSIVSDPLYGGRKTSKEDLLLCPRLFLHAASLRFIDTSGEHIDAVCPLPLDLKTALKNLK